MYTGYLNRLWIYQGSALTSYSLEKLSTSAGVEFRISGVKGHSSLGIGERIHESLIWICKNGLFVFPLLNAHNVLNISLKAMNYKIGENGFIPSKLGFGQTPLSNNKIYSLLF